MEIGLSTASFYPMDTYKALKHIANFEVKTAEIFFNTFSELELPYISRLKSIAEENNIKITSIHPFTSGMESFMLFSQYKARFYDMAEYYKRYNEAANFLGAKIVVIHGDRIGAISDNEYLERFARLMENSEREGVITAQENNFRSASPQFILKMKNEINAKFVFDIKQSLRSGQDPYMVIDAMGENLVHVHLSDSKSVSGKNDSDAVTDNTCMLPGRGNFNFLRLFNKLNKIRYSGDIVIEVYKNSYKELSEIKTAYKFCRNLLKTDNNMWHD